MSEPEVRHFKRRRRNSSGTTTSPSVSAIMKLEAFAFIPPPPPSSSTCVRTHPEVLDTMPICSSSFPQSSATIQEAEEDVQQKALDTHYGQTIPGACEALLETVNELVDALKGLTFKLPVTCVYNPLIYAIDLHEQYVRKHGGRRIEVLLVGMNPGPFGMAQTGVPFGDSRMVRDFHCLTGLVGAPFPCHPKRPIYGLQCPRAEVSGQRLWGWARDKFGCAAAFFTQFWVYNYCPLVFMEASGKNRTPDKLHPTERQYVETVCDKALIKTVSILQPLKIVGVGKYAANKIRGCGLAGIHIGEIMHPSPANPRANKDWSAKIEAQLVELGVILKT